MFATLTMFMFVIILLIEGQTALAKLLPPLSLDT